MQKLKPRDGPYFGILSFDFCIFIHDFRRKSS